jgi:flagellar motor switch protein FliN
METGNTTMRETVRLFLDDMVLELKRELAEAGSQNTGISWNISGAEEDSLSEDLLLWWTATRGGVSDNAFAAGGFSATWVEIGGADSGNGAESGYESLGRCIQVVLEKRFGPTEPPIDCGPSAAPPDGWTRATIRIKGAAQDVLLYCGVSPELEKALANLQPAPESTERISTFAKPRARSGSPVSWDMLMDVEVPVRVSFGRTQIRMKQLLALNAGSLVELDRALGDQVEVLVNRRVIARGEVVAVDGNYGVRILELISNGIPTNEELN